MPDGRRWGYKTYDRVLSVYNELPSPAAGLLRLARYEAGITQAELARRAGVPASMVSAYERDRRQPTLATLLRLLKAAGYELRMHLAPYDDHDDVLAAQRAAWPQQQQEAWESYQRARVEAGRPIVEAESRRRARAARQ
ncbi:MAG: helix-turn-helix transcriptional regulator [Actinobacteria bacterium]|nr:helix-turn-helix transcriptional regulator [Actinomycetota bacterium]